MSQAAFEAVALGSAGLLLGGGLLLAAGLWWLGRGIDTDDTPPPIPPAVGTVPVDGPRHRAPGRSLAAAYQPRHGFDEVPPSVRVRLAQLDPVNRARELVRQLAQWDYSPWRKELNPDIRRRLLARWEATRTGWPVQAVTS